MSNILQINQNVSFDDKIIRMAHHTYNPHNNNFENGSEIKISINQQDLLILLNRSYIYLEGVVTVKSTGANVKSEKVSLTNNSAMFLFDQIRYDINGIEVDNCNNPGISTTIKNYVSLNASEYNIHENASWTTDGDGFILEDDASFSYSIPLSMIFGVAEDFKKIIAHARHEFTFIRARSDLDCLLSTDDALKDDLKININRIQLRMMHVDISDNEKLVLYKQIKSGSTFKIPYRTWEYNEMPVLTTTKNLWTVKTSTCLEKPRFIILGFQTARKHVINKDISKFDHCGITDVRLFLNSEIFPYDQLNIDFAHDNFALLYDMYIGFQHSYYNKSPNPILSKETFKRDAPLFVIDCSRQNDTVKSGVVDIRLEVQSLANMPANTKAYCLIIHDRVIEYNPLSNIVRKVI